MGSSQYVGEIRIFAGTFAPSGWFLCNGELLPISEYEVLFNLIGTTYGGDGESTFALPNLQGRVPVHTGGPSGYIIGQIGGSESVTLSSGQLPAHTHAFPVSTNSGTAASPAGTVPASWSSDQYSDASPTVAMGQAVQAIGGSQPHENRMPYLGVNFIIAWSGVFPSES